MVPGLDVAVESAVARHDPVHGGQLVVLEGAGVDPGLAVGDLPRRVLEPHVGADFCSPKLLRKPKNNVLLVFCLPKYGWSF